MKRIALIGYGYWGKRLLRYLWHHFDVACVFGRTVRKEGIFTNRIKDAFADGIDAVVIATPIDTHYELAKQALEAEKHVLCEKPLAQRSVEVQKLVELAKKKNLTLMTEFTYTFSKGLNHAKEIIDNDGIGTLMAMELSLRRVGRFSKFDVYWLLASHMLSVLDMFVPLDELITFKKIEIIQGETGVIVFGGRIKGQIFVSINYPHRDSKVVFYGRKGTLIYSALGSPVCSLIRYTREVGVLANKLVIGKEEFQHDESNNLMCAVREFANVLEVGDTQGRNLKCAFQVTRILEMMEGGV